MKYIATRPRTERLSSHGLFSDDENIDLDAAMAELDSYTGNVWTHIISLQREDAVRLGYDNASAWRNLIRAHRNDIAAAMKIPPKDFRWYAAFHAGEEHALAQGDQVPGAADGVAPRAHKAHHSDKDHADGQEPPELKPLGTQQIYQEQPDGGGILHPNGDGRRGHVARSPGEEESRAELHL